MRGVSSVPNGDSDSLGQERNLFADRTPSIDDQHVYVLIHTRLSSASRRHNKDNAALFPLFLDSWEAFDLSDLGGPAGRNDDGLALN